MNWLSLNSIYRNSSFEVKHSTTFENSAEKTSVEENSSNQFILGHEVILLSYCIASSHLKVPNFDVQVIGFERLKILHSIRQAFPMTDRTNQLSAFLALIRK